VTRSALWLPVLAAGSAALVVAFLGGSMTDTGPWYQALKKPDWQPPGWVFAPAWTIIFALAALSAGLAWRDAPTDADREWVIAMFAANGVLNVLWSALFFTVKRPDWSLWEVGFLWVSILVPALVIGRYSRNAALLLLPYLAWVAFAAYLNYIIVRLNGPFGEG
jgi:tryptophan-rich sensory protein